MEMPGLLPLYRWDGDDRVVSRILTLEAFLEATGQLEDLSTWTGLRPEEIPVFLLSDPSSEWPAEIFYLHDGRFVFLWMSVLLLEEVPRVEHAQAMIWPFARALLWAPGFSPRVLWPMFRTAVFIPDEVYERARGIGEDPSPEVVSWVLEPIGSRSVVDGEGRPMAAGERYRFIVDAEILLHVRRVPTGWFMSFVGGAGIASKMPTLWNALKAGGSTVNRPRLLPESRRQAELDRIGIRPGRPLLDPTSIEPYWILGAKSPLLWSSQDFYSWYRALGTP